VIGVAEFHIDLAEPRVRDDLPSRLSMKPLRARHNHWPVEGKLGAGHQAHRHLGIAASQKPRVQVLGNEVVTSLSPV